MVSFILLLLTYIITYLISYSLGLSGKEIQLVYNETVINTKIIFLIYIFVTISLISIWLFSFLKKIFISPINFFSSLKQIKKSKINEKFEKVISSLIIEDYKTSEELLHNLENIDKENKLFPLLKSLANKMQNKPSNDKTEFIQLIEAFKFSYDHNDIEKAQQIYDVLYKQYGEFSIVKNMHKLMLEIQARKLVADGNFEDARKIIFNNKLESKESDLLLLNIFEHLGETKKLENLVSKIFEENPNYHAFMALIKSRPEKDDEHIIAYVKEFFVSNKHKNDAYLMLLNFCLEKNLVKEAEHVVEKIDFHNVSITGKLLEVRYNILHRNVIVANKILGQLIENRYS